VFLPVFAIDPWEFGFRRVSPNTVHGGVRGYNTTSLIATSYISERVVYWTQFLGECTRTKPADLSRCFRERGTLFETIARIRRPGSAYSRRVQFRSRASLKFSGDRSRVSNGRVLQRFARTFRRFSNNNRSFAGRSYCACSVWLNVKHVSRADLDENRRTL